MSYALLAGRDPIEVTLSVPRTGTWRLRARLDIESAEGLAAQRALELSLDEGRSVWTATAVRIGVVYGLVEVLAVGGAGGLARELSGQSYRQATVRAIVSDILGGAGEQLDGSSSADVLGRYLARWTRIAGPASSQLAQLVTALGLTWRMLPSGRVWVGSETWPEAPPLDENDSGVTSRSVADGRIEFTTSAGYRLAPGTTFESAHISYAEHVISEDGLRTTIWTEKS